MNTAGPVIRARYLETEEHLLEAWDRNPKKGRWSTIYVGIVIAVGVIVVLEIMNRNRDPFWWIAPTGALAIAGFMLYRFSPPGQRSQIRKLIRKQLLNPATEAWFEFSEDGFLSTGRGGKSAFHPWTTIPRVLQVSDGLLIYYDEHNYYWIPQRAFESAEDYGRVVKLAQTKAKLFLQSIG